MELDHSSPRRLSKKGQKKLHFFLTKNLMGNMHPYDNVERIVSKTECNHNSIAVNAILERWSTAKKDTL